MFFLKINSYIYLFIFAALVFLTSCASQTVTTEIKAVPIDPTSEWRWKVPSPPAPAMAWVPAGSFRTADRTPENVTAIIIHTTEGRYIEEDSFEDNQLRNFSGNINYFRHNNRNVSAHYVMGPKGEICVMVDEKNVAHTQTYYNGRGFGIECAGWSSRPETWTPEMMDSLVELCAYLCVKWEIPAYHPEGTAYEGPWSLEVDEDTKRFTGPGLVGHFQVQPWNKSDPGKHFPWEEFSERVRERISEFGVEPIPLPEPGSTTEIVVTANIKEEDIFTGEPFTWVLTIAGEGVDKLSTTDVIYPDTAAIANAEKVSEPTMSLPEKNKAVFELQIQINGTDPVSLHAGKVMLNGTWYDSPTVRVTPKVR